MAVTAAQLPVRRCGENRQATYYKCNGAWNVVHSIAGDRLCCLDCRSCDCIHVRAVQRHIASGADQ